MDRFARIAQWLQQADDELLYDVDGGNHVQYESLLPVEEGLYAGAVAALAPYVQGDAGVCVPLRIALVDTTYRPTTTDTVETIQPCLVHPGLAVTGCIQDGILMLLPLIFPVPDVPYTAGGMVVLLDTVPAVPLLWLKAGFPVRMETGTLTLMVGRGGLIQVV